MSQPVFLNDYARNESNVLTIGTFDGLHLGHQVLIKNVVSRAREQNSPAVVVTFHPHPRTIIHPGDPAVGLLTTLDERARLMENLGIDHMVVIPFNRDFSMLSSEEFIQNYVFEKIGVKTFVIGYDHHFGRDRKGSINTLHRLSSLLGFEVYVQKAHEVRHTAVSSSLIRKTLQQEGDVARAAELLGRPYELAGTVVKGDGRGRTLGFPTANLHPEDKRKVLPANGVYFVESEEEGETLFGMMNIGSRPTFDTDGSQTLEIHLFDFSKTIYGFPMRIRFLDRIRGEIKFGSPQELVERLHMDRQFCLNRMEKHK
ncbi:bifunctional riboflavin kinase/FAD synthetase [Balneolaceae bacterium ANBcel3]|nr:bifunctional riboflavin kinase/FAD synthetase [Balneolaceae bacterium ANBcel3]